MAPVYEYLEKTADTSPASAGIGQYAGSTVAPYMLTLDGVTADARYTQLQRSITDVLGFTGTKVRSGGSIERQLPLRHPIYQWMFADEVSYTGVGKFDMVTPSPGPGSALINQQVPVYKQYELRVPMSARPYNSWQDQDIQLYYSTFYYKNGALKNFRYAAEWYRFTEWITQPKADFITAQQGQMAFRVSGSSVPNGYVFQDAPKLFLPDSVIQVNWFNVPYRYVTSYQSYLSRFVGYINQYSIGQSPVPANSYPTYAVASLLYQGATVNRIYTNPVPDEGLLAYNTGDGYNKARLCDLTLTFAYTPRLATAAPPTASNLNWIYAGWNLQPWLTTRGYYATTSYDPANPTDPAKWVPPYLSFPFQLLFTDPDLFQPDGPFDP